MRKQIIILKSEDLMQLVGDRYIYPGEYEVYTYKFEFKKLK